jgi:Txe/YoeB family toxin of Txe-Axe toxin-antitoxin module
LLESADWEYLQQNDRRVAAEVKKLIGVFGR